jgi:K+-transporting ATPase ATPase C chain
MRKDFVTAIIAVVVFHFAFGLVYPLVTEGVSQGLFPGKANGSKVYVDGKLAGSSLIGQSFEKPVIGKNGKPELDKNGNPVETPDPRYFQERPSATTPAWNPSATTFSNYGPNSTISEAAFASNIQSYIQLEGPYTPGLTAAKVPVDAVNTSASGVDPDISQANAWIQANRIATVRHLPLAVVDHLISSNTDGRSLGVLGEPGVNVLKLNIAIDHAAPTT